MKIIKLDEQSRQDILSQLLKRDPNNYTEYEDAVQAIVDDVRAKGDEAVFSYTERFDGVRLDPSTIRVTDGEIQEALAHVDPQLLAIMKRSMKNIRTYHEKQLQQSWFDAKPDGTILGQKVTALSSVGVYVPGGKAAYPSSVLMNIIPAEVAGVPRIVMVTPPGRDGKVNPVTLIAAHLAGATEIYKVGGAQAVAALALGTESVPKVDKIVGPGNIFVATAKKQLYGVVDIDMIAGPSEILIVADETANPRYLAADLMSQAEHDPMASAILITNSRPVAEGTVEELTRQMATLSRREIIQQSLDRFGGVIICENLDEAVDFANELAPEHLEVCVQNPFEYIGRLDNAGSVFLGNYSPEPLGDYFAGANHVLPTGGTARFFSPLSVDDFIKKSSFIYYPKAELQKSAPDIIRLAETEELTAHANSIRVRVED